MAVTPESILWRNDSTTHNQYVLSTLFLQLLCYPGYKHPVTTSQCGYTHSMHISVYCLLGYLSWGLQNEKGNKEERGEVQDKEHACI